jgi:hypothetical protein
MVDPYLGEAVLHSPLNFVCLTFFVFALQFV